MYFCIDMKSFFASVECSLRGLDPLNVALAVVDATRGDGALVMAATPKLKSYGVASRCRLFEIPKDIFFIKAKPRMKYYIYYAKRIHEIFLKYVSPSDCFTYSIDESFLKVDEYLKKYKGSPKSFAISIMNEIKNELGIYATCGAGDNMYLSKIALDIMAKKNNGYFYLTEDSFKRLLWNHRPLIDFWRIGVGTSNHLERLGLYTMKDISECDMKLLRKEFGIIGDEIYLHSLGKDNTEISDIFDYSPKNRSISRSQILFHNYDKKDALICLLEMTFMVTLNMCSNNVDAKGMTFFAAYDKETGGASAKSITFEYRLRDYEAIAPIIKEYFNAIVLDLPIRSIGISFFNVLPIKNRQLSLFHKENERYITLSKTISEIHYLYGKNSIFMGMSLLDNATILYRNRCIGGHNGE